MAYTTLESAELLLVDDNVGVISMLQFLLQRAGYQVRVAMSGREAVQSIERFGVPSLALVDIHMPDMNGMEFARYLRQQSRVPIIMITAQSETETIVDALSEFADDYLVKPFSGQELLARIERVLRRTGPLAEEEWVGVDDHLRFNPILERVDMDGKIIELTPLEMKLLELLAVQHGRTLTAELLLSKLWPTEQSTRDQLRVTVFRLRQKLQRPSNGHSYVVTERGVGYRLEVDHGP